MFLDDKCKKSILLFAREPQLGRVKTRLLKDFSPQQVDQIYRACLQCAADNLRGVPSLQKWLYFSGTRSLGAGLAVYASSFDARRQSGKDLGVRMQRAFTHAFAQGSQYVLALGSDCPLVGRRDIQAAFAQLKTHDLVLGPALDGGYYLIGMRKMEVGVFKGIPWGTSRVLSQTRKAAQRAGLSVVLLEAKRDIDTPEDVRDYADAFKKKPLARRTAFERLMIQLSEEASTV